MNPPLRPVARLLIDSVLQTPGERINPALASTSVAEVVTAGQLHRVTPAVGKYLSTVEDTPREWAGPLGALRHSQLMRHMRAREDLRHAATVLDDAGIGWVAVKGPVVADLIWPSPDMREYYDLDLIVDRRRFGDALEVLEGAGCSYVDRNWPMLRSTMRAEIALKGPLGTPIDLHWDIAVPKALRRDFDTDITGMLARSTTATLGNGAKARVLDPVDTVFHLAFHAAQAGVNKLMWLGDIHYAVGSSGFRADKLVARARAARAEVPVALVMQRTQMTLGLGCEESEMLVGAAGAVWGRLALRRDASSPFPGLPDDPHLGGNAFTSARRGLVKSTLTATRSAVEIRRIERQLKKSGSPSRPLGEDVPDARSRREYLDLVETAESP